MRGDHRDNAAGSQNETFSVCLLDGIRRFIPDLSLIPVHERILSHAATEDARKKILRLRQGRKRFPIMPIDNLKLEGIEQREVNVVSVQMQEIAPKLLGGFQYFFVVRQAKCFVFFEGT